MARQIAVQTDHTLKMALLLLLAAAALALLPSRLQ